MFVGVYGILHVHPWLDPTQLEDDAYSLFAARAVSMGWASADGHGPALWGMNDAGQDLRSGATRVAWFQVEVAEPGNGDRPLPVQPVLVCAGDTLRRIGRLDLTAVSILLPLASGGPSVAPLVSGLNWFTPADPGARCAVHLTVEPGEDDVVRPVADEVTVALRRTNTGPFTVDAVLPDGSAPAPEPAVVDDLWLGEDRHPVTFACSVPEWTPDAIGWLVALVGEGCRTAGVRTSVLVSVGRAASAGPAGT